MFFFCLLLTDNTRNTKIALPNEDTFFFLAWKQGVTCGIKIAWIIKSTEMQQHSYKHSFIKPFKGMETIFSV